MSVAVDSVEIPKKGVKRSVDELDVVASEHFTASVQHFDFAHALTTL